VWGVIGGSGLETLPELEQVRSRSVETPYGPPSGALVTATLAGEPVAFVHRHGGERQLAPHQINYRANLWALKNLGVRRLVSVNAVGSVDPALAPGDLVVPDQLLDYTWGREHSFNLRPGGRIQHIDFTQPYSESVRAALIDRLQSGGETYHPAGVYACTQGPRLETAAEVRRLARDGATLVGMTGMPEAALARELELDYAALCLVVNRAAGLDAEPLSFETIVAQLQEGMGRVRVILQALLYNQNR